MKFLFILNGPPYGDEKTYNALRLAGALAKKPENQVRIFLMADAVIAAKSGQKVPEGFYNIQNMLNRVARMGDKRVALCGTCMEARGLTITETIEDAHKSTLQELADWTEEADKVLIF